MQAGQDRSEAVHGASYAVAAPVGHAWRGQGPAQSPPAAELLEVPVFCLANGRALWAGPPPFPTMCTDHGPADKSTTSRWTDEGVPVTHGALLSEIGATGGPVAL